MSKIFGVFFCLLFFNVSYAETLLERIQKNYPDYKIKKAFPTGIPELYELHIDGDVVYGDASGKYFFFGDLVEVKSKRNLTAERKEELGKIVFKTLPFDAAIVDVKGKGGPVFAVFSDPECSACVTFEKTLSALNSYTAYIFLLPTTAQSMAASQSIVCSKSPVKAYHDYMRDRKLQVIDTKKCNKNFDKIKAFATMNYIMGTPTIFRVDGARLEGNLKEDFFLKWLKEE